MKELTLLNSSEKVLVDDEDYPLLSKFGWKKCRNTIYLRDASIHRFLMLLHERLPDNTKEIDHCDTNPFNCQKINLRLASHLENCYNRNKPRRKNSTSIYKGVSHSGSRGKFMASIKIGPKWAYLGQFHNEMQAAAAYNIAAFLFYNNFARVNPLVHVAGYYLGKYYEVVWDRLIWLANSIQLPIDTTKKELLRRYKPTIQESIIYK
jgi:hypothetical protein